jgi:hypothetical protein
MSELIHAKDKGTMIEDNNSEKYLKYLKCGYKVLKSELYNKYDEGLLELPVKR